MDARRALEKLRPYQRDVVERAARNVGRGLRRGIIQGECGSGKTWVAGYIGYRARFERDSRVLILADRRRLVKQMEPVMEAFGIPYGKIMAGESKDTRQRLILASRDTLANWVENGRELPDFDLVMVDEVHRVMAKQYMRLLDRYQKACVIGLTGTPARDDGKSLGDYFQWLECMVPPSQLIQEGHLIRPEVWAPPELAKKRKKGSKTRGLAGDPVASWFRHAEGMPTIAFCRSVREAMDLRDRFNEAGVVAEAVHADVSDDADPGERSERDEYYERLARGQTMVLASVGLLIEGVDIPEVSCAILWSKFGSMVKFRQAIGRTMRPANGKTKSVVLDHSGAAGQHGLPGDDVEWSLDLNSTLQSRRKKALEDGRVAKPIVCGGCGLVFSGQRNCPECSWMSPAPKVKSGGSGTDVYQATDELLKRLDGEQKDYILRDRLDREWKKAIYIAVGRGGSAGMAASIFKQRCRLAPWEAKVSPLPAGRGQWREPASIVFPDFVRSRV